MSLASSYPQLVDDLAAVRGQWRVQKVAEGILLAAALVAGVLVAVVAADNLLKPGTVGRGLLALALWGTAGWAFLRWVLRRWLEDRRDDFFAALVEERHPELANRLINALQLGRGNHYGSPRLIEAIVEDAARATADLHLTDCLDWRLVRRYALVASGVALVIVLYATLPAWSLSSRFANGLARVAAPWATIPPFTATRLPDDEIEPGNARIPEGADVTIAAVATGEVPAAARLYRRAAGGEWRPAAMQPGDGPGAFMLAVPQAAESFDYYVAAGDARSTTFHVEVVPRPRVSRIDVELTAPAYALTGTTKLEDTDGEIAALPGSRVELRVAASKPLKEAWLITDGEIVLPLVSDGEAWSTSFTLSTVAARLPDATGRVLLAPARYRLRLLDTDGYENADPLWHSLAELKDAAPTVALAAPGRDMQVRPGDTVNLKLVAQDDFALAGARVVYRVNEEDSPRELASFSPAEDDPRDLAAEHAWDLASLDLKTGDVVQYWATAADTNDITGPGQGESRRYALLVVEPEEVIARLDETLLDYADAVEELLKLQQQNRAQTTAGAEFAALTTRESDIRDKSTALAERMRRDAHPAATIYEALDELAAGPMAELVRLFESGEAAADAARAQALRDQSLPVQDRVIETLQELLNRLQRNDQARQAIKKLKDDDSAAHWQLTQRLDVLSDDLERMLAEDEELAERFERLPKQPGDELGEEQMEALDEFDEFAERWNKWTKGTVDELSKLPSGFIDDFGMREDVNRIFQEIERVAERPPSSKIEVALEDLGAGLATEMLEDLEVWMPNAPDSAQWVLEEPLSKLNVPEMPLPGELEDMVGDLLQEAEEFDEAADDITSAWGDNLNQAGWDVADGPISSFSAKGKTGNDLPNANEMSGRSGDGRRGQSSGQMVGDTARALEGRKTPARVNNERYEPGQLKREGQQDPNGATGGGKKAGAGRRGLQGGTPPDFVKDMERLTAEQAQLRERAEQVAETLEKSNIKSSRLDRAIELMRESEEDLRDTRYADAARRRKVALTELRGALTGREEAAAVALSRARELPAELREELLQAADEGYPPGYETLLQDYFRALSEGDAGSNDE
jgi:hypothetical protein